MALEEARRRHVGRQHALLDEAVGVVAHQGVDGGDTALVVELETGLRGVEVNGPALGPRLVQGLEEAMQFLEVGYDPFEAFGQGRIGVHHQGGHLVVGQAGLGAHHRREELGAADLAVQADQHLATEAEAVDLRVEGAEAVGEDLWQHGDDPVGEVDRVAAAMSLLVQGRARGHVGGDIGDAHQQAPALGLALAVDGVVEVTGVGAVDGHQGDLAQIDPPGLGGLGHLGAQTRDLRQDRVGELHRQVMGADGDVRLHAGGHVVAHHLGDATDGLGTLGGLVGDLGDDDLALLGGADAIAGDDDVVGQALVVRHHEADATLLVKAPHHGAGVAGQDLHHRALQPPAGIAADDPHHRPVVVEQGLHLAGVEIDVIAPFVGDEKAKAVGVANDSPGDQVAAVDQAEGVLAVTHELAVADHGGEAPLQGDAVLVPVQVEGRRQFLEDHGHPGLGQGLQDELAAGDGVGVLARLALAMGVGEAGGGGFAASGHSVDCFVADGIGR